MFILEEPYVSVLLKQTLLDMGAQVLDTPMASRTFAKTGFPLLPGREAADTCRSPKPPRIYSNSENALDWITTHLDGTGLHRGIRVLKDKVLFRRMLSDLYPGYRFQEIPFDGLAAFDPSGLRLPFVVKPAVGFFSLGVHVVNRYEDWPGIAASIHAEASIQGRIYPGHVLGFDRFIAEESIVGEEYAVDAYFDSTGKVIILNILGHLFASQEDVSDRVYYTSPELIRRWRGAFTSFLEEVGRRAGLHDFPIHAELRVDQAGKIAPIEVNPMRFAGWCVTDLAHHAYGINPYTAYMLNQAPDWDRILESHQDRVFAFLFVETASPDSPELLDVLGADLTTYLILQTAPSTAPTRSYPASLAGLQGG